MKIDYPIIQTKKDKPLSEYGNGYYILKMKDTQQTVIISVAANGIHFCFDGTSICSVGLDSPSYPNFYKYYELIGKIKDMRITDIELEEE